MLEAGLEKKDPSRRLAEINRAITTSLNFDEVLDLIVRNAAQLVEARLCLLLLVDQGNSFRIRASHGIKSELARDFAGRMEEDVVRQLQRALSIGPEETLVSVPIIAKQSLNGLLVIVRAQPLNADEQWQLSALADQAAIALQNARLYEIELAETARARNASETAQRRLAAIVESSEDAVISKSLEGIIETWNKSAERVFGFSASEVVGKPITLLIPEERIEEEKKILKRIRSGDRLEHFETLRRRKDGTKIDVSLTISPIRNEQGQVIGASTIVRDITESKKAEEQLKRALAFDEAVMSSMGEGLYTVDPHGRLTFMNPAAQRLLGWSLQELIGRKMHDVTHHTRPDGSPFPAEECPGLQVLQKGTALSECEDVFIRKDGSFFDVLYSSSPLRDEKGEITGLAVVFRDTSDRKHAEMERAKLLRHAEQARAEAEEANRLKDEFLATLSHELRNPLNVVIGYAEILRRAEGAPDSEFVSKAAEVIRRNALAQSQLVSDLLDLSRLQMGKLALERQPVSLSTVITDAIETVKNEAADKGVKIAVKLEADILVVDGNPVRLGQIAWNLLNNAVKFTPPGGTINVDLTRENKEAKLVVQDNGQGINADFLPYVFEIFRQGDASSVRKQGGMGIGLALVKRLAELHGGRVSAHSDGPGSGATFTVWIPLYQSSYTLGPEKTGATGALKKRFILVVDDSTETTEMLGKLLELEGAFVETAAGGEEALTIAKSRNFDLIISDISMPEMDGYQLLRNLRQIPGLKDVPAVALTGYGRSADIERTREEGFAEHLTKPLNLDRLLKIVKQLTSDDGNKNGN